MLEIRLLFMVGWISITGAITYESSSEHPASSLLGTPNIGSSFGVMKTGFTENYTTKFKSPPPPPKSATPPHQAPTPPKHIPTITDLLDRSPPSTPCISSA
ncbi:hypothetical protein D8674_036827 [Pyrus ussuriensis x Pyrus communis]|uniref:Uncharacterized protein n=1 Tax=Pyrus ussuriensis x Pyrus communis TaxID=2448454 RepID=A0A5N5GAA5_9ROSA|nr:hypothetical protein D8674_036827 [Pyrus ussuriensis x Pyrus communis]